jgi:hypothetical protein
MLTTFQIKNTSGSSIFISELSLTIPASSYATVTNEDVWEANASGDLRGFINAGTTIINNGSDLNQADSLSFLDDTLYLKTIFSVLGHTHPGTYEPVLGNPASSGYVLSSTTAGVRSWVSNMSYTLPAATTSTLGGVIIGTNISVSAGTISIASIPWSIVASTPTTISGYGIVLTSSNITTALGYTPINSNLVGAASGLATLDGTGKLTTAQIPASLVGALVYQGTWNASTNTPTLTSGVGTKGWYYKVSVAGTTSLDGFANWGVGDLVIFDGTTWDGVEDTENVVTSFNTRYGAVTLTSSDVTTALTYTPYNSTNPAGYITAATLPTASTTVLGGVKIDGTTIIISSGVISHPLAGTGTTNSSAHSDHTHTNASGIGGPYELALGNPGTSGYILSSTTTGIRSWVASAYTLPAATISTLGGIIVGTGLGVSTGTISVSYAGTGTATSAAHSDHTHSGTYEPVLGNPGTNGYVVSSTTAGVRSWIAPSSYTLPTASTTVLGGVKVDGTSITITNGVISTKNFSLNDIYNNGTTITTGAGAFNLDSANGYAPLQIGPETSAPTAGLAAGQICTYDNTLFMYDAVRGHWLSVDSVAFSAAIVGSSVKNSYMLVHGDSCSATVGYVMPFNGTIVMMGAVSSSATSNSFAIYRSGASLVSLAWSGVASVYSNTTNADFSAGDILSPYISGTSNYCTNPVCWFSVRRRI